MPCPLKSMFSHRSPSFSLTPYPYLWHLQVNRGTVVAVGPGRRTNAGELIPVAVKEGDEVLLPEYGGTQVKLEENGDKEYV